MSVPFHKQTNPAKTAGQVVYGFDREPYLKHSNVAPDVTLSDYIKRKEEGEKKITFDEWHQQYLARRGRHPSAAVVWNAALTKGKL